MADRILIIVLAIALFLISLPKILRLLGFHPDYKKKDYNFEDKKALIITTSHDTLNKSGKPTGVYASEMTVPYYEFKENSLEVELASINGGKIPIEPFSLKWPLKTEADQKFLNDQEFLNKAENSIPIHEININEYDLIFLAGGWGAAYDLRQSEDLGQKITEAYSQNKIIGAVCHGPLGLLQAVDENGNPLVKGRKMTAVTDKQIKELRITETPYHPETELRKAGADFKSNNRLFDTLANNIEIDGNIITGQNQNAAGETAQMMMKALSEKTDS